MNKNLLGRLHRQGLLLAASVSLVSTGAVFGGTATNSPNSEAGQWSAPVYGDNSTWGRYFRELQDTMALKWYEEITYYDHRYVYSRGLVTARYLVTPDGTFHNPQIVENTANEPMASAVVRAIKKAWIQRFPADVVSMAPGGLVVEQTFRYWEYDGTNYGLASSYPQMLTRRSPEIGGASNIDLRKFFDLSRFRFQSRIIQTAPASSRLASR